MSWAGADDSWLESDVTFATWLMAMATFQHRQVLAEALTPRVQATPVARETRPYPKATPKPPRPRHVAEHLPTETETFTNQQIRTAERLLGLDTKENINA